MITIHVLGFGELYQHLLNALAAMMGQSFFESFLRLTALIGIIMASIGYIKQRDPMVYVKWILMYVLVLQLVITPKTTVEIYDISAQRSIPVSNVPVMFALTASLITNVGVGLAESYDALLSMPDDLTYTKTGSLFGSKIIQASRDFRIINPELKAEMSGYLRNCVVGDIRLNHKYSVNDLSESGHIWDLISKNASPLRMTEVNGKNVTCKIASNPSGEYSLRVKLNAELKKAYSFFGINLFGHTKSSYEKLFETHLISSFAYYQKMTDTSADIFMQSMMINAIGDGIKDYQAFSDSTAGVINNQVTKSEVQHRWSWAIAGQKAAWFLPILHTLLTVLLFGIFPVIIAMTTLPFGLAIFRGYLQFFISLQFWPVLFAILNAAMTMYGASQSSKYGGLTLVNIDKINELHADLSGVAGYLMLMIPFLAKGLISNLSDAFNQLATSMTAHLQGSAMSTASDAANASFNLGQTSFYNTNANSFSANKHDNNWTHMHGMHSEQLKTGVIKTKTASGDSVFDVSPGMTRGAVSINASSSLSNSLNKALEESKQVTSNESQSLQTSLSNFSHHAVQLSKLQGHDMRLGRGVSESESSQYSEAVSRMTNIASDVAMRLGVSQEDALARLTNAGSSWQAGLATNNGILGGIAKLTIGAKASTDMHGRFDSTSTNQDRYHESTDNGISSREAQDFNNALNHVENFTKTHHFDENKSEGAQLSKQIGADLRDAQTLAHNIEMSKAQSSRISAAEQYVKSHSAQITTDMNQAFPRFVEDTVGEVTRDKLFASPGDIGSLKTLETLGDDFISKKRDALINEFKVKEHSSRLDNSYNEGSSNLTKNKDLTNDYESSANAIHLKTDVKSTSNNIRQNVNEKITDAHFGLTKEKLSITKEIETLNQKSRHQSFNIKEKAKENVASKHALDEITEFLHIKNKDKA